MTAALFWVLLLIGVGLSYPLGYRIGFRHGERAELVDAGDDFDQAVTEALDVANAGDGDRPPELRAVPPPPVAASTERCATDATRSPRGGFRMFSKGFMAKYRKGAMAVVGGVAEAVALGLLHGNALTAAEIVLATATAAGVIIVPNDHRPF